MIVEGPFDAIAVTTAGARRYAGLAPCGTALTSRQVSALARLTDLRQCGVLVALDGDNAGQRGTIKAYQALIAVSGKLSAAILSPGRDPAADPASRRRYRSGQRPVTHGALGQDRYRRPPRPLGRADGLHGGPTPRHAQRGAAHREPASTRDDQPDPPDHRRAAACHARRHPAPHHPSRTASHRADTASWRDLPGHQNRRPNKQRLLRNHR